MEIKFMGFKEILTIFPLDIKRMLLQYEEWEISKCKLIDLILMNKNKDFTDIKIWAYEFHSTRPKQMKRQVQLNNFRILKPFAFHYSYNSLGTSTFFLKEYPKSTQKLHLLLNKEIW